MSDTAAVIYVDEFGTPLAFPFILWADDDGDFQNLSGVTASIEWINKTTLATGEFTGATLTLLSTVGNQRFYKVTYPVVVDDIDTAGRFAFKIKLIKVGLRKKVGSYYSEIIVF